MGLFNLFKNTAADTTPADNTAAVITTTNTVDKDDPYLAADGTLTIYASQTPSV